MGRFGSCRLAGHVIYASLLWPLNIQHSQCPPGTSAPSCAAGHPRYEAPEELITLLMLSREFSQEMYSAFFFFTGIKFLYSLVTISKTRLQPFCVGVAHAYASPYSPIPLPHLRLTVLHPKPRLNLKL